MALAIGSNFAMASELIPAVYDRARHRYRDSYLHDPTPTLYLSVVPGLERHQSTLLPGNPVPRRHLPPGRPATTPLIETWNRLTTPLIPLERQIQDGAGRPAGGTTPPVVVGPPIEPPEEIVAYDWVIASSDTAWRKHLIVQNPGPHDVIQSLQLDGAGTYSVRMRVFATGNRFFEKTVTFSVQQKFIVGIGDSFASGEGNPDQDGEVMGGPLGGGICDLTTAAVALDASPIMDRDPVWLEPRAHRSFQSHHVMAALSLQDKFGETWNKNTGPGPRDFKFTKVTFASFARSGATIRGSLLSPQGGPGDFIGAGQIEELRRAARGRPIDALLISIGGNDAGFSGVLKDLVKGDSFYSLVLSTAAFGGGKEAQIKARLDQLLGVNLPAGQKGEIEVDLETLRDAIDNLRRDTPVAEIYINGYPEDLFFVKAGANLRFSACGIFETAIGIFSISEDGAKVIKKAARIINDLLKRKADEFGWHFIPLAPDFAGHGYCQGGRNAMWIFAEQSCRQQGDFDGTMHPTYLAHSIAALRYREQLVQHTM
jgi:hypothetical protein